MVLTAENKRIVRDAFKFARIIEHEDNYNNLDLVSDALVDYYTMMTGISDEERQKAFRLLGEVLEEMYRVVV
jgi:hypothetical protein